ncbi:MAG: PQQ-binding-like beta-propeller repeat protein, partial [Akkermansiaceae bacterium]|nr:PQQ-binding-like beta-propeller repeat protein [Akkermansiaceae bacterium]
MKKAIFLLLAALAAPGIPAARGDVTSWRNGGNGVYPDAAPPAGWDAPAHVLWKVPTPVRGNAAPILVKGRLFYSEEPAVLVCADAKTGETLWKASHAPEDVADLSPDERKELARAKAAMKTMKTELDPLKRSAYRVQRRLRRDKSNPELRKEARELQKKIRAIEAKGGTILQRFKKPKTHDTNGYASYTACSDGEAVYTCNGTGVVAKFSLEGKLLWSRKLEEPDHGWGGSVSPTLVGGKLIVKFADYTALDPGTGEELWRTPSPVNFGVPASFQLDGRWFLYTCRGELFRVSDGKKLPSQDWVIKEMPVAFFNTPFVDGNRIYVAHGFQGFQGDIYCMEMPETVAELEKNGLRKVWYTELYHDRYYATPVVHEGLVYTFSMRGSFQVLEASNGKIVYQEKIPGITGRTFPGILLVGGKLVTGQESGTVLVIEPGREYREIARFEVGECRSNPIFDGKTAYLRTIENLYA